jgi:hypothetical protein
LGVSGQSQAWADTLEGNRDPSGFVEREHVVRMQAHPGYLEMTVQRTVENLSKQVDEATVSVDLPNDTVATNLRSRGVVGGKVTWFQGELLDAEVAANRYAYLTGYGQALPKDPAWLYWTSPTTLGLQVFPCAPQQPKTVEYRLLAPMAYAGGRFSADFSIPGLESQPARIELAAKSAHHRVWLNQHELAPGSQVTAPNDATDIHVDLAIDQRELVVGELAQVALGTERSYVRAELRAKPKLATIPRDAYLVFLFDMSRSVGNNWEPQQRVFEQLAALFPNARVAAWGFDRAARPITDGFMSFEAAKDRLASFPKLTRNGSRADLALKAAAELLARTAAARERTRVFMLSDARAAARLGDAPIENLIRALPGTMQLVEVLDGSCALTHVMDMPWLNAVEATSGTAWLANVDATGNDCRDALEELARPKRLFLQAVSLEGAAMPMEIPEVLDEGEAFVQEAVVTGHAKALGFEAKLWGKAVTAQFQPDATMSRIRAALATTNDTFDLTEPELRTLAKYGRAVTRLTSYLAIEPGVRPSRDGFEVGGGSGQGFGAGGSALSGASVRHGDGNPFNRQAFIEAAVDEARKYCGVGFLRANVELETDLTELLDVVRAEVPDAYPSASGCLTERLWELALPKQFNESRARFVVLR